MTDISSPESAVVLDYLSQTGWRLGGSGALGELWVRGNNETVIPRDLRAGTSPWRRLALTLAVADGLPQEDVSNRLEGMLASYIATGNTGSVQPSLGRVELEIHLDGVSVVGHETSAYAFGQFVMRTADSVKELVKSTLGIRHRARELVVVGGPTEGSVEVRFREPDLTDAFALIATPPQTAEGTALTQLAVLFGAAERSANEVDADYLRSHLTPLHKGARLSLARLAECTADSGWVLSGVIRTRESEAAVRLGPHAATVLAATSRDATEVNETIPMTGVLDGWAWSASELTLISDGLGTIRVAVPMPLQQVVAELNSERDTRVFTRLNVLRRLATGSAEPMRATYSLSDIGLEADLQPTLS